MFKLLRVFPVILWSGGAFIIGAGFAYGDAELFPPAVMAGAIGTAVLLHGITAPDFISWILENRIRRASERKHMYILPLPLPAFYRLNSSAGVIFLGCLILKARKMLLLSSVPLVLI